MKQQNVEEKLVELYWKKKKQLRPLIVREN